MSINATKYVRKPFFVEAVLVTDENMAEVAEWAGGELKTTKAQGIPYIHIRTRVPRRPTKHFNAMDGDWILKSDRGCQVYPEEAFLKYFEVAPAGE